MVKGEGTRKITGRRGEHLREKLKKRGPSQQDRFLLLKIYPLKVIMKPVFTTTIPRVSEPDF